MRRGFSTMAIPKSWRLTARPTAFFPPMAAKNRLDILDYSDIAKPFLVKSVNLSQYIANVNSVDVVPGLVAVVGGTSSPQSLGKILFFDQTGKFPQPVQHGRDARYGQICAERQPRFGGQRGRAE